MKTLILLFCLFCGFTFAADYPVPLPVVLEYYHTQIMGQPEQANYSGLWEVSGENINGVERNWISRWHVTAYAQPTPEQLIPLKAAALTWHAAKQYPSPDITIPILDASGEVTGTARILADADLNIIAVVNSASPQKSWAEQKAAATAEIAAKKAAIDELGLTPEQIQAVKDYFSADVDVLFSGLTANQRKFLKIQRALVKALSKETIKAVRE